MGKYYTIIISLVVSLCAFSQYSVASLNFTTENPQNNAATTVSQPKSAASDIEMYLNDVRLKSVLEQAGLKDIDDNVLNVIFQPTIGTFNASMDNFNQISIILSDDSGTKTELVSFDRSLHKASLQRETEDKIWIGVLPMSIKEISASDMLIGYKKVKEIAQQYSCPSSEAASVVIYKLPSNSNLIYDYRMTKKLGNMESCDEYLYIPSTGKTEGPEDETGCKFSFPPPETGSAASKLPINVQ